MKNSPFFTTVLLVFSLLSAGAQVPCNCTPSPATATGASSTIKTSPAPNSGLGSSPAGSQPSASAAPISVQNVPVPMLLQISSPKISYTQLHDSLAITRKLSRAAAENLCIVYPGNTICFTLSHPLTFLRSRPKDQARVVLYMNGKELEGIGTAWESAISSLTLAACKTPPLDDNKPAKIYITLSRNDSTQQAWMFLYNNKHSFFDNHVTMSASIGWAGMSPLDVTKDVDRVNIVFYYQWIFIPWLLLFCLILAGFLWLGIRTNALREGDLKSAYSLSVTQLLFWTTLVIGAFVYTLVLTDIPAAFNSSVLLMLGISMTTTGAATLIDSRFKQTNQKIQKPANGFLTDILTSDGTSYSVQRIQTFAWNIVLGLYFIIYTIINKTMPEFSTTLLFLAGISSASYITTKPPENTAMANNPPPAKPGLGVEPTLEV